jgi:hypothetical protein
MVSGNTANEYGDYIIASFNEPYAGVDQITDWEIVVGLKTPLMTGLISVEKDSSEINGFQTQFTNVFQPGDIIIIGNIEYEIDSVPTNNQLILIEQIQFTASDLEYYKPTDSNTFFDYEFRWSQTGSTFSEFHVLNKTQGLGDLLSLPFNPEKPLYIDTKFEVSQITPGNSLAILSIDYIYTDASGNIISCPNVCFDDAECDSFGYNGCANIQVTCDDNQFQPYKLDKSNNLYKQLVNIASDIFGHEVQYFRTEPDLRTSDVILMEYSLHNVVAQDTLKILVPDNEFPSEANTYDIFGIEYAEFEIHITAAEFEKVFGSGKKPRNKDYMYIPLINRMYEVNSLSIADEFNKTKSYWRIKLVKYQERTSVFKNEFEEATDNLTTGIEEIFGEQIGDEYEKNTKPDQFQTVSTSYKDGIREFISKDLSIIDFDLKNRWTVVSKNYYDLTEIALGDNVLQYDTISKVEPNQNIAFTGWFKPQFDASSTEEYFLFGDNTALTGYKMYISNTTFKIMVNGDTIELTHNISLDSNKWYSYIINISNEFLTTGVYIYSLDLQSNVLSAGSLPQSGSNNLVLEFDNVIQNVSPISWDSPSKYILRGNDMYMTNIRVFNTPIELEQHINVLNQYVVRDNQLATIIDNAIPSLGFQKFANAK